MKLKLPTLLLIALLGPTALAQSSPSSSPQSKSTATRTGESSAANSVEDDPVALAVEKAVDRALLAEAKVGLYEEKLKAKDDRIEYLTLQIETLKQQKSDLQSANKDRQDASKDRKDAGNIDAERLSDAKALIAKQDAEIARLRAPGFFASLFDKRTIYGAVAGFGVCKLASSQSARNFVIGGQPASLYLPPLMASQETQAEQRLRQALKAIHQ